MVCTVGSGLVVAQAVVALAFALEHWLGGWPVSRAVFGAGFGALVFGMAAIATRGLALPIGLHTAMNFGISTMGQNVGPGMWRVVVEPGQEARVQGLMTMSYFIVMSMAFLGLYLFHRRVPPADLRPAGAVNAP